MTTAEKLITISENQQKVYDAGYEKGKADSYDAFWDSYQSNGEETDYRCAFSGFLWSNATFKPKYSLSDIKFSCVINMFQYSYIETIDYDLDFSECLGQYANYVFSNSLVKKIQSITLPKVDNTTIFNNAKKLTSIRINGTTEYNFSLVDCPLDEASLRSVIGSLSETTTGKTCTLNKAAVNAAFTTEQWEVLTNPKENWTFTLK